MKKNRWIQVLILSGLVALNAGQTPAFGQDDDCDEGSACFCFEHVCAPMAVGCLVLGGTMIGSCSYNFSTKECSTGACLYLPI